MKIIKQGFSLSEDDLQLLDSSIITEMLKHRILVEFDETPDIESFDFSGVNGFYFLKSLGSKLYQFWFQYESDYNAFYSTCIAFKMSNSISDK
jgi:CRISPR/Cas system-associated protein Cas5 (RAMP superfamily)